MTLVRAAGGVLWRTGPGGPEVALVHRPRHGDWSLPKGKLEHGERFADAALREVREETACGARLDRFAGFTLYRVKRHPKLVLFWHMLATAGGGSFEPNDEIDGVAWLDPRDATARLTYRSERLLLAWARVSRPAAAGSADVRG